MEYPFTYNPQFCQNCKHYNPDCQWLQCDTELFGNTYSYDHGCWAWEIK